ncbi:MAG: AAA-associated domain-containing protein [Anaerolineales bacterium]|nr:AAA-associated domain-containing protein [Anaerolineales bacterium]
MPAQLNANGGSLLSVENVTKAYGRAPRRFVALQDINLSIRAGEFVGLLGPSGCGKSTLLRIIAGLNPPTSGQVLYRGEPVAGVNPHATIVFQTFALYPWLTVLENVEVALKARGVVRAERRPRSLKLIDTVGLDGFESAYPRELSGGMRQKVGFARAMAVEPELLCLDEPFSALDVLSAEALRGELLELWTSKAIPTQAILMVTHNIEEAVLMADRIVVMDKDPGRVVTALPVRLRHPRQRKDTAFQALVDKVYAAVAGRTEPEAAVSGTAPGQPGATEKLPAARINALAGLMERLNADSGQADLYRLAAELKLELDDLLPIVEAAELLGFAQVAEGDIRLTPLGQTFADASILARKEIIAGRILRQPTVRWVYETLLRDNDQRIAEAYVLDRLRDEFGEYAQAQLDTAINWARYAEIFAFDDDTGELYLEK